MRSIFAAALALVLLTAPAAANGFKFFHLFHVKHYPAPPPPASKAAAPTPNGGSHNPSTPYIAGGYYACVNLHAIATKARAKRVAGVYRNTYRDEAAIFGDCAIPLPIFVDGRWRTLGGELFWWFGGRDPGYSDPDFAIKQLEARDRIK